MTSEQQQREPITRFRDGIKAMMATPPGVMDGVMVLIIGLVLMALNGLDMMPFHVIVAMILAVWCGKAMRVHDPAFWKIAVTIWAIAVGFDSALQFL